MARNSTRGRRTLRAGADVQDPRGALQAGPPRQGERRGLPPDVEPVYTGQVIRGYGVEVHPGISQPRDDRLQLVGTAVVVVDPSDGIVVAHLATSSQRRMRLT